MPATTTRKAKNSFLRPAAVQWTELGERGQPAEGPGKDELTEALLGSLQMQHLIVLAGSGCSLSAGGPSMRDLWDNTVGKNPRDVAVGIAEKVNHDVADPNIEAFLSRIEAYLQVSPDGDAARFLNESRRVILEMCTGFLDPGKLAAHSTFLHRLSRRRVRDPRLKIFTTNYDLCFERASSMQGGVPLDGFSFTGPRYYDPRFFSFDIVRRPRSGDDIANYVEGVFLLYKLHGSVNWSREADGSIREDPAPKPQDACIIYPARGKYQQAFTQPHLESMAQYLAAVREPNTCVLSVGFGFNDDHLSEPLLAAVRSNPHLRLVIVDLGARSNVEKGNTYWIEFGELARRGEDVWLVNADFSDFADLVPDLKSLTPAESLLNSLQRAVRK